MQNCNIAYIWHNFMASSMFTKMCDLIRDIAEHHCTEAFNVFDSAGRRYLKDAMDLRSSVQGD